MRNRYASKRIKQAMLLAALLLPCVGLADSGRWKDNGNQTLIDTFTGQQWTKHDNLKNINWNDVKRYCETLALAGGRWQLPAIDDLAAIYNGGRDGTTTCGAGNCKVLSLFYLTLHYFWSATSLEPVQGDEFVRG